MTTLNSVFANTTNKEPLTHEEVQKKYKECSTNHGLTEAKNGQTTKLYGCNQCKVHFHKDGNGWHMNNINPAQDRLFGFKEEVVFNSEDEAKALYLESKISKITKGQNIKINRQEIGEDKIISLFNFIIDHRNHERFKNVIMDRSGGDIRITKK